MKQDGRRDKRQPIALRVRFKSATLSDFIEKHSGDVSRGGIFIKTKKPMPVGTLLKFEFLLKSDESLINGVGRVVWTRLEESKDNEPPGMGIKFIKLDDENKDRLEQIVSGQAPKNDLGIDEPFGAAEGQFPPQGQFSLTPEFEVTDNLEELDLDTTGEKDSKPPIAVPRAVAPPPKQRGPSVPVPAGAKGTMLGYVPIGEPPPERGGEVLPSDAEDLAQELLNQSVAPETTPETPALEGSAVTSEDSTRPVPTTPPARGIVMPDLEEVSEDQSLIETRENVIDEDMLRSVEGSAPEQEAHGGFAPGGGERESGILKDISMAIDTALTRKKKEAAADEAADAVPPAPETAAGADDQVISASESVAPGEAETSGALVAEDEGISPDRTPSGIRGVPDLPIDEGEEPEDEDDVNAHEAVVLDEKPVRSSVPPGKPVVEATRAGAEAKSPTGVPVPLVIFLVVLILGGGAGAAWWFLFGPGKTATLVTSASPVTQKQTEPVKPAPVVAPKPVAPEAPSVMSSVEITTEPADARVYLAGELQKKSTPLVLGDLPSGKDIEIRLSAFGYLPLTQKVMVDATPKKIQLKMEIAPRRVVLKGSPRGATVFANGKIIGKLGSTTTVENNGPGFSYLVRKTGFQPKRGTIRRVNWVELEDAWQTEISARLKPVGKVARPATAQTPAPQAPAKPAAKPAAKPQPTAPPKPVPPKKKKPTDNLDDNPF